MSLNPEVRVFEDPNEATMHMAALISKAHLHEARAAMSTETPPEKKRKSRKRPLSNPVVTSRRERQRETQRSASETHLQELRDTLTAVQVPEATDGTVSAWAQRQLLTDVRMKTARPMLFNAKLSAERIAIQKCHRCCAEEAAIRCLDCVPLDMEFLCATCDMEVHKRNLP
ncbi:hypothetical protein F7725_009625 [Dissostichus mawsoni]|uniref:Uncharacterized protein n=1 Tax=Dissostichus mawsoni TaxID=36200 RepID=A0A7J5XMM6_DISMA|nr:hypothetical protein F7725_009625 [Dissostichus mawsoni]